ncbi:acyl carrier protein [Vibrio vulnificus]|uniref:acyl carrier protein n=1 Tax=Vibrio vulnificus TaxID=672 RepID=UPI001EEBF1B7|nr:acyl carrier protein [Vibrio vulnificus]MCG6313284.1 acyl carrier protein [Vibrio vulnificus]
MTNKEFKTIELLTKHLDMKIESSDYDSSLASLGVDSLQFVTMIITVTEELDAKLSDEFLIKGTENSLLDLVNSILGN